MKLLDHINHEHKDLRPQIEQLKTAADMVGTATADELPDALNQSYSFLTQHLTPHAKSEEEVLYALVAKYSGTSAAVDIMTRDHEEVAALTAQLGDMINNGADDNALRDTLYTLHSLISLHFNKEEQFMLPVLEAHLTAEDDEHAAHHLHSH